MEKVTTMAPDYKALAAMLAGTVAVASAVMRDLASHPAFAGDAPEFNKGGIGYGTCKALRAALAEYKAATEGGAA